MEFEKINWQLFKLDRRDHNKAEKKIHTLLNQVFQKGVKAGKIEERKRIKAVLTEKV